MTRLDSSDRRNSLLERERLKDLHSLGLTVRAIAAAMGRSPSTISRELRRNTVSRYGYLPHNAHRASTKRRQRPKISKLAVEGPLRDWWRNSRSDGHQSRSDTGFGETIRMTRGCV